MTEDEIDQLSKNTICTLSSMPSWDIFKDQPHDYRDGVLLPDVSRRGSPWNGDQSLDESATSDARAKLLA